MTPTNVSGISQTLPLLSAEMSNSSSQEKSASAPNAGVVSTKESKPVPLDTVSIAQQTWQAIADVKKEETIKDDNKSEATAKVGKGERSDMTTAKVQFVYDLKGELITKYMDSADRIVYQVPTELSLLQREMVTKSNSSVDTKA